jgi:hypothetical protein
MISGFSSLATNTSDQTIKAKYTTNGIVSGSFSFAGISIGYALNPEDIDYPNTPYILCTAIDAIGAVVDAPNSYVTIEGIKFGTYLDPAYPDAGEFLVLGISNSNTPIDSESNTYVYINSKKIGLFDDALVVHIDPFNSYSISDIKTFTIGDKKLNYVTINNVNHILAKILT